MTRVLAELLGADRLQLTATLSQLEQVAGRPKFDIRLTTSIIQKADAKMKELGLDPKDTTAEELYHALAQKLEQDDRLVRSALAITDEANSATIFAAVQRFVQKQAKVSPVFALKSTSYKQLLKKSPPKKALKDLGYRSLASMLKNESAASLHVAVTLSESESWKKRFYEQYLHLTPSDFEVRPVTIEILDSARWEAYAFRFAGLQQQNIRAAKELATIIMSPTQKAVPKALTITTLIFALDQVNDIRSSSAFLKFQQVAPDFGHAVLRTATTELLTDATLVKEMVPWKIVHQYYARYPQRFNPLVFEPHVVQSDLSWQPAEHALPELHEALTFWQDTQYIAQQTAGQTVSFNIFDVALSYCNQLPFAQRVSRLFKKHIWHEIMLGYLDKDTIEQALIGKLALDSSKQSFVTSEA